MKKSLVVAAAMAAMSITSGAMALDTISLNELRVQGFYGSFGSLGWATFTALGINGGFCDYLMNWSSPFNPNDVQLCIVRELRTAATPSCIVNERVNIPTTVLAGPSGDSYCAGFNIKGEPFVDVSLILGESFIGLTGVAIIPNWGLPTVYPIASVVC